MFCLLSGGGAKENTFKKHSRPPEEICIYCYAGVCFLSGAAVKTNNNNDLDTGDNTYYSSGTNHGTSRNSKT